MGRLGEVPLLLNLLLLLGTLHGVRANFDDYDFEEEEYDFDASDDDGENEEAEFDYEEGDADDSVGPTGTGSPPQSGPKLWRASPDCNNEGCQIELTWEPPLGVCLVGYRLGFRPLGSSNWTWIDSMAGTHVDLRSGKHYILEENAQGSQHFQVIPNLPYQTTYQLVVEAFNFYGLNMGNIMEATTPPG